MSLTDKQFFTLLAIAGLAVWYVKRSVDNVSFDAVNPASTENLIYSGVNNVGTILSGDEDWNLGGWLYDITHD